MHDLEEDQLKEHSQDAKAMSWLGWLCGSPTYTGRTRCLDDTREWCFDDFGRRRQPDSLENINTTFDLYTSPSSFKTIRLSEGLKKLDNVDMENPWKIIAHGWRYIHFETLKAWIPISEQIS